MPLAGVTAFRAVSSRGGLASGEKVLVTGAGGGTAVFAIQFALALGGEVYVTSGSQEKIEQAKKIGIRGGSAFRAIAGFGRHGILHEEHFFDLAADLTIEVEFVVSDEQAEQLFELLRKERVSIFYVRVPAEFGAIEGDR